ncbi:hypothetical protein [Kangiella koreensis]|uniref:Uncharacterized protein n=1 Tax=Kangiella koreensis (strain DSM 16069 / JCM 12317 / KCTC 12182 / SW-125) TaxID=523791 RepID=C7R835_KANKD|nr:hypothetical protein [Kangiella koreensis]ACV25817.1 hypothetical protein Kkor_0397 [Kangiella koreensis DSM 16069]
MGKTKIAIIIVLLLIASALLIVNFSDKESPESVASFDQIESEHVIAKSQPMTPENQEATIKTENVGNDANGTSDESLNEPNEKATSSGLDIMTNQEQVAAQFDSESKDYHWSGYWENELQTIVLFVGAKAFVKDSEVECRSSTCEVTVNLSVKGPQNTVEAVEALSQEFAQREIKFVPESIDPANGKIVFYTQTGDIPE